jgi:hypothetical protein
MDFWGKLDKTDLENHKKLTDLELEKIQNGIEQYKTHTEDCLEELRLVIKSTATVSDEIARQAATNAVDSQKVVKDIEASFTGALEEVNAFKKEAEKLTAGVADIESMAQTNKAELEEIVTKARNNFSELEEKKSAVEASYENMSAKAAEFDSYLEQSKDLPNSLKATKEMLEDCKKLADNIQGLLNHSLKRKSEIDELHKEIYGEDISNSEGEVEHTSGRKDELDVSYTELTREVGQLKNTIKMSVQEINAETTELQKNHIENFNELLTSSTERFNTVDAQLTSLLPGAMAAGLSAAYEEKKSDEIKSLKSFDNAFRLAIIGMVFISCLPLIIDIYLLIWKDIDLLKVLKDTPTLLLSIMPLYFPILWLAYSSNKKSNLSKRLIEEYTHKSVLGKTFSGLSNQIDNLQNSGGMQEQLRTKLLFNILQVSAENPGKLITNYNKSDHPLMDALENSARLADSVSALAKIPGFSAIATKLSEKADDLLEERKKKVEFGIKAQSAMENESEVEEKENNKE